MDFLRINGAHGEGGGQIIRTAITLSCITNKPIHIENIRKNRKNPGLKPQHLTAIKILQKISNAKVVGAKLGSLELKFVPGNVTSVDLVEDVRTAGSISLILQVLIPVIAISQKKINLRIIGGTDVSWSPSITYTKHVLSEAYKNFGIKFSIEIRKRGYFPKGGGEVRLHVFPSKINSCSFLERETRDLKVECSFSKIAVEEIKSSVDKIIKKIEDENFTVKELEIKNENALDEGASLLIYSIERNSTIGVDALYQKEKKKFEIDLRKITENMFGVDENLSDMIVVPASLGPAKTRFRIKRLTNHLETNLFVTSKITGCKYGIGKTSDGFEVIIEGISNSSIKQ